MRNNLTQHLPHHLAAVMVLLAIALFSACATQTPQVVTATPSPSPTAVPTPSISVSDMGLLTEDGIEIAGKLFSTDSSADRDLVVVLAHMGDPDQVTGAMGQGGWEAFARRAASEGYSAFTFDFRCYGGSGCAAEGVGGPHFLKDLRAVVLFLRDQGFERIVCVGASLGGTACGNIAMETELAGLVIVASTRPREHSYPDDLVSPGMPKLFVVAENDYSPVVASTNLMYDLAPQPAEIQTFPGNAHGTNLFHTESGAEFGALLMAFLEALR